MKEKSAFPFFFSFIMLFFVVFLIWYIPSVSGRTFALQDLQKSLETSQGRERKQQYEYDKVVAEIPEIATRLEQVLPQTKAAEDEVAALKGERKKLRNEKKELESQLEQASRQEVPGNEQ